MAMHISRRSLGTLAVGASALTATGCTTIAGGGSSEATPGSDGKLAVGVQYPIENLDPHGPSGSDNGTQLAASAIFSRLVSYDESGENVGLLAESWKANADASEWTFTLRDGVTFSDGRPLSPDDVIASLERTIKLKGPLASNFEGYEITTKGERNVTITPPVPEAALLAKLTTLAITPADAVEKGFDKPIGAGPFIVDSFEPGSTLVLKPNSKHWDGAPDLSRLTLRTIPEVAARMTALQTGEIHISWGMPDDQVKTLKKDDSLTVEAVDSNSVITMWMNSSAPSLKEAAVRRALWQAVDFETIIEGLFPETGSLADSVVTPNVLGYAEQTAVKHDPGAAKSALADAGFDFDKKLRFQYSQPQFAEFVRAVASDLEKIGVQVDVLEKEAGVFLDDLLALKWDINIQQLGSAGFDAATNLGRLYTCTAHRTGYCNKKLDALLAAAGSTSDLGERKKKYAKAIEIIWDDAVGMYPMFVKIPYVWKKGVKGFTLAPDALPEFSKVSFS